MDPEILTEKKQRFNGKNYYKCGRYYSRPIGRSHREQLHRAVWEFHNGPIPPGTQWHVHHLDGNTSNNCLSNLELISGQEHASRHMQEPNRKAASRESIKIAIAAAPEWHRSEAGLAWHQEHAKESLVENRPILDLVCQECGDAYQVRMFKRKETVSSQKYCSLNCKMRAYRRRKMDPMAAVDAATATRKQCEVCKRDYLTNRPKVSKHCSPSCTQEASRRLRKLKKKLMSTT